MHHSTEQLTPIASCTTHHGACFMACSILASLSRSLHGWCKHLGAILMVCPPPRYLPSVPQEGTLGQPAMVGHREWISALANLGGIHPRSTYPALWYSPATLSRRTLVAVASRLRLGYRCSADTVLWQVVASRRHRKIRQSESGTPTRSTSQRPFFVAVSPRLPASVRIHSLLTPDVLQDPNGCLVEMSGHEYAIHCLVYLGEER